MKINYYCPINELAPHLGRLLLLKKPLRDLHKKDKALANSIVRAWLKDCLSRIDYQARNALGTPLFKAEWDRIDAELSLDEWWVLDRMGFNGDYAAHASDYGFESVQDFARHAELAWRLCLAKMVLKPPKQKREAWIKGMHS